MSAALYLVAFFFFLATLGIIITIVVMRSKTTTTKTAPSVTLVNGSTGGGSTGGSGNSAGPPAHSSARDSLVALASVTQASDELNPGTGIVSWLSAGAATDKRSSQTLRFVLMGIGDLYKNGAIDWSPLEEDLDKAKAMNAQAVLRFRLKGGPNDAPEVPSHISGAAKSNYPDWTNAALKAEMVNFHTQMCKRYDGDPRIFVIQQGFGHYGEYHIHDAPSEVTDFAFPSDETITEILQIYDTNLKTTQWALSLDIDGYFESDLVPMSAGIINDTMTQESSKSYHEGAYDALQLDLRSERAVSGGEFHNNVESLDSTSKRAATKADLEKYHVSYCMENGIVGRSQKQYLDETSADMGYRFQLSNAGLVNGELHVDVTNVGVAPPYYQMFLKTDGAQSTDSLQYLAPGQVTTIKVGGTGAGNLSIVSPHVLGTQSIYFSTG